MENVTILPAKHSWEDLAQLVIRCTFLHLAIVHYPFDKKVRVTET